MRVCLQCDSEYVDDPARCRSCDALTVTPEQAALQRSLLDRVATEKLVDLCQLEGPVDQGILSELLTQAGIGFAVHGGASGGGLPGVDSGAAGYGSLLVLEEHVERAGRVLRQYQSAVIVDHDGLEDAADADTKR